MKALGARIAVAIAVVGLLAGCSTQPILTQDFSQLGQQALGTTGSPATAVPTTGPAAGKPADGACWQETHAQWLSLVDSSMAATSIDEVPCSQPHQAVTIKVARLKGTYSNFLSAGTGDSNRALAEAAKACNAISNALLPGAKKISGRLLSQFLMPTETEWANGARWARCDLLEYAVGTPYTQFELADLPDLGRIAKAWKAHPTNFEICVDSPRSPKQIGPTLTASSKLVDCKGAHDWRSAANGDLPQPKGAAYPAFSVMDKTIRPQCGAKYATATVDAVVVFPSRTQWANGDRFFDCWIGKRL